MESVFAACVVLQLVINSGQEMDMVRKGQIQQAGGLIHEFGLLS